MDYSTVSGPQQPYAVGVGVQDIIAVDFNGDDILDLAVTNFYDKSISVIYGDGFGAFWNRQDYCVGSCPFGIVAGDFGSPTPWTPQLPSVSPAQFEFAISYPNPFNSQTRLTFTLPRAGNLSLGIFNVRGSKIVNLINSWVLPGKYFVTFNASHLPSGVYFARLTAGDLQQTQKLLLIK